MYYYQGSMSKRRKDDISDYDKQMMAVMDTFYASLFILSQSRLKNGYHLALSIHVNSRENVESHSENSCG